MTPRALLTQLSAGRIAAGVGLMAAPRIVAGAWIGADGRRPAVGVLARALGVRDAVLGAGTLAAMKSGQPLNTWLLAGLTADAVDLLATHAARDRLPGPSAAVIYALAGGALVVGAANLASMEDSPSA